jgi:hypothetical protein
MALHSVSQPKRLYWSPVGVENYEALLLRNAGTGGAPRRELTVDGFELVFGTNPSGHEPKTALRSGRPRLQRQTRRHVNSTVSRAVPVLEKGMPTLAC